jgi:hypothetical protein
VILTRIVQAVLGAAAAGVVLWMIHEAADQLSGADGDRHGQDPAPVTATEDDEDDQAA